MPRKVSLAIHPGEHIADELEARGMTAAELARTMGVDAGPRGSKVSGRGTPAPYA
jgi:plasmid maintenance system antidote protein VapI